MFNYNNNDPFYLKLSMPTGHLYFFLILKELWARASKIFSFNKSLEFFYYRLK